MPTLYTDVAAKQVSGIVKNRVESLAIGAQPLVGECLYTTVNTEAAGDEIQIAVLPAGAKLLISKWKVASNGVGSGAGTIDGIGIVGNSSLFSSTAITITTAIDSAVTATNAEAIANTVLTAETPIIAKLGISSSTLAAGKKINFRVEYAIP
jgi:hypothetical protein